MPAFPWVQRQDTDPDRCYLVMASRLPISAQLTRRTHQRRLATVFGVSIGTLAS